ncbi:NlpC/P60 family protein [Kitasatospora sp. NPDC048540]|uniref:C40 family peptidase n=1 Tax=unclassified Kitasatospora TaxID=2633591 RepID=UPI00069176A2|nr:C40 family peptidase [Kitasatospora sp. MBT63]
MEKNTNIVPVLPDTASAPTPARTIPTASDPQAPRRPGPRRASRILHRAGVLAAVLASTGALGLGGAVGASAESAPAHSGWDGSKYWFKNSAGQWRWTVHYDVYLARISGAPAPAASTNSGGGIKQGWDGSKYWFKNSAGQWRWTTHYDVYQARISGAPAPAASTNSGGGIKQGWDGSKYWFKNAAGQWRWTTHYDVYLSRISGGSGTAAAPVTGTGTNAGSLEAAVQFALGEVGVPFLWGGNGPGGYDCSGLVQQAYRRAGISLPRVANDQYAATTPISASSLRRGDLLFWSDTGRADDIEHVAIYLGNNQYVEAARPGTVVRISKLSSGYYPTHMGRP